MKLKKCYYLLIMMLRNNYYFFSHLSRFAKEMAKEKNKTAQWITKDAIRELTSEKIQKRIEKKSQQ